MKKEVTSILNDERRHSEMIRLLYNYATSELPQLERQINLLSAELGVVTEEVNLIKSGLT